MKNKCDAELLFLWLGYYRIRKKYKKLFWYKVFQRTQLGSNLAPFIPTKHFSLTPN